jgi:hypothetical protein
MKNDNELIQQYQNGSVTAFDELVMFSLNCIKVLKNLDSKRILRRIYIGLTSMRQIIIWDEANGASGSILITVPNNMPHKDIALIIGKSESSVKTNYHYGINQLKKQLGNAR